MRFVDEYLPDCVPGYPVTAVPRWSTAVTGSDSGTEQANSRWESPLNSYSLPDVARKMDITLGLRTHFLVMNGPAHTWPFRDPFDFASVDVVLPDVAPVISATDQNLGTGDGARNQFQLVREYVVGSQTWTRTIYHPVVSSVVVALNGSDPLSFSPAFTWSVDRLTGIITFDTPPEPGMVVTAGFLYDVEVRFESDDALASIIRAHSVGGYAEVNLIEVRPC